MLPATEGFINLMEMDLTRRFNLFLLLIFSWLVGACHEAGTKQTGGAPVKENSRVIGDTVSQIGNNIMAIYQDRKNVYWFGSWETGIYKYDGKTIINYTTKHGLPDNRVEEIKEDKYGNLFINTRAGLCKYDGKQIVTIPAAFPFKSNWTLQPDDLWFKSAKPGHVNRYDGKSLMSLEIPKNKIGEDYLAKNPNAIDPYGIYCIYKDSKGNIWFGMALLGAFRFNGKSFDWISEPDVTEMHNGPANGVRSIAEDRNGDFWFNTLYKYNIYNRISATNNRPDSTRFYERVKSIGSLDGKKDSDLNEYLSILKDNSNNLWMAIYLNGVWKYDGERITHYPIQVNAKTIPVYCLYKDNNGDIWLGTHENGAFRFNGQTFEQFTF